MIEAFAPILAVIWLVLAIGNWIIYHKIFSVAYFDLGRGLMKEAVCCFLAASLEMGFVIMIFQSIGGFLLRVLGFAVGVVKVVLCIALALVLLAVAVYGIKTVYANREKIFHGFKKDNVKSTPEEGETWICPKCGTKVSDKFKFCIKCGSPLKDTEESKAGEKANE